MAYDGGNTLIIATPQGNPRPQAAQIRRPGHVYALDAITGHQHWKFRMRQFASSSPVVSYDSRFLFIGSSDGWIYSLDAKDGTLRWEYFERAIVSASPVLSHNGEYLFFVAFATFSNRHLIHALNVSSGAVFWSSTAVGHDPCCVALALNDKALFVAGTDKQIHAVNSTSGSRIWTYDLGSFASSAPVVSNDGTLVYATVASCLP